MTNDGKKNSRVIVKAGLIAGTLDILAAFAYYYIKTGKNPLHVLGFVAKTVLGNSITANETVIQVTGLLFHFCIAFAWTLIFFWLLPKIKWLRSNAVIAGLVYGIFVWVMMNLVIMPLYRGTAYQYTNAQSLIVGVVTLMLAIGLPVSVILNHDLSQRNAVE